MEQETPPPPAISVHETAQALIVGGYLPESYTIDAHDARPLWDFHGICALLNQRPGQLVEVLKENGPVYSRGVGIPSSWKSLIER